MPGIGMPLVATSMSILGVDVHAEKPPGVPLDTPHLVVWYVGGLGLPETSRAAASVQSPMGSIVGRAHDAAPCIPHIPVPPWSCLLAPKVYAAASSRSNFGVGSVRAGCGPMGGPASEYPVAVAALLGVVGNQLHCNEPMAGLTGLSLVGFNSPVQAGFTIADLIASVASIQHDILLQAIIDYVLGKLSEKVAGWLSGPLADLVALGVAAAILGLIGLIFGPETEVAAPELAKILEPFIEPIVEAGMKDVGAPYLSAALGAFVVGSPMGWCGSWTFYSKAVEAGFPNGDDAFELVRGLWEE